MDYCVLETMNRLLDAKTLVRLAVDCMSDAASYSGPHACRIRAVADQLYAEIGQIDMVQDAIMDGA